MKHILVKNQILTRKLVTIVTALAGATTLLAQDKPAEKPAPKWESSANVGFSLTRGNSKTVLANVGLQTAKKWQADEIAITSGLSYGENNSVRNVDNYQATVQYNHIFKDPFYGGLRAQGVHDEIANLDYRFSISPLGGVYLIKNDKTRLSTEVGPSVVFEKLGGVTKTYLGVRVGERFEHKFNDRAKMWQSADWTPQVDRLSKYILNFEIGVDAAITSALSLRTVLQDVYDSKPAPGRQNNDIRLVTGIAYKF
jgi:putative salt-induced outer membrane protein